MTTLETNKGRIMATVVPMDATDFNLFGTELQFIEETADSYIVSHVNLPKGEYEFIGVVDRGVPDFDVEPYVKVKDDWRTDEGWKQAIVKYFLEMLKKNGIDYENRKIVILGVK